MVNVCLITYNHQEYIGFAIQAILMQETTFDYQIVIGEDCSTDNTRAICEQYASQYPNKIKLLPSEKNWGMMPNFIRTLSACSTKYIALCDGDDYWTDPLKLQKQVDFLEKNKEYSACFHPVKIWLEDKQEFTTDYITRQVAQTTTIKDLIVGNYIHTPSVVYRTRTYPEWFSNVSLGDYAVHCLNALDGKIYKLEEEMAVYRVHKSGTMQTYNKAFRELYTPNALKLAKGMYLMFNHVYQHTKNIDAEQLAYGYLIQLKEGSLKNNLIEEAKTYSKELLRHYSHKLSFKSKLSLWVTIMFPNLIKKLKTNSQS